MIASVTHVELVLDVFPIKVRAMNNGALVKEWSFTKYEEAYKAFDEIWGEVFKAKEKGK